MVTTGQKRNTVHLMDISFLLFASEPLKNQVRVACGLCVPEIEQIIVESCTRKSFIPIGFLLIEFYSKYSKPIRYNIQLLFIY